MATDVRGMFKDYVDDDEVLLGTIHKHGFGLFIIYAEAIFGVILALGLAIVLLPRVLSADSAATIVVAFGAVAVFFAFIIIVASTIIYHQSSIVITDKNITQILQTGLFGRKVSQLTMANVEDVSAKQHGIFATMLDFGELQVETAGEQDNFEFGYCPRPGYYAKVILEAREKFITREYPYAGASRGQMRQYAQEAAPMQPQPLPPVAAAPAPAPTPPSVEPPQDPTQTPQPPLPPQA